MMMTIIDARRQAKNFTAEQIEFGKKVWADMKRCWNFDSDTDEAWAEADRQMSECKRDWLYEAIVDEVVADDEEYEKLIKVIRDMDMSSMTYC